MINHEEGSLLPSREELYKRDEQSSAQADAFYVEHLKQAWADCQSASDEFDKSILTYASAGLGLSLAFVKDIVPLEKAVVLPLLFGSWVLFAIAILITVSSFAVSVQSQETHMNHLRLYYRDGKGEYLNASNRAALWVRRLRWIAGSSFAIAIISTITFSIWNVSEVRRMSTPKNLGEGRTPMGMTPIDKGRTPMGMTPLKPSPAPVPPANSSPPSPPKQGK